MSSRRLERVRRGGEIAAREAGQRERPEHGRDRPITNADREQVALPDLGRPAARRRCRERLRRPRAKRGVAGQHRPGGVQNSRRAQVDRQRCKPPQRALGRQPRGAHPPPRSATVGPGRDNARVTFTRIAWLLTVLACVVTGVALLVSGYVGYAAVFGAVGACAAINLR
jgi:hypothetical protein